MKKKDKKLLMWGAAAVALYFLTRPKTAAAPVKSTTARYVPSTAATRRELPTGGAVAGHRRMGMPYTYSADI